MRRVVLIALLTIAAVLLVRPRATGEKPISWLGRALRGLRSGDARSAANDAILRALPRFEVTSTAFGDGMPMPAPYVDAGARLPPLAWNGVPAQAVELALIVEDIDVPFPAPLTHAVAYGIDPASGSLGAGAIPRIGHADEADPRISLGRGMGGRHFLPPTPIPGHGAHRYVFELFAVRAPLHFAHPPTKGQLVRALRNVAIAHATMIGTHEVR